MLNPILALCIALQVADPTEPTSIDLKVATGRQKAVEIAAKTPKQALRMFFTALMTQDEATLRAVTQPSKDFKWLLKSEALPANGRKEVEALVRQPIRTLKPGDEYKLLDGRIVTVSGDAVTKNRSLLLPKWSLFPMPVEKQGDRWRVDASSIIAGRKAAAAARREARSSEVADPP